MLDSEGTNLLTSTDSLLISVAYQENGQTTVLGPECGDGYSYCPNISELPTSSTQPYQFVYHSIDLTYMSLQTGREWYITVGGKTDTLYYELRRLPANSYATYEFARASFNGRPVQPDTVVYGKFGPPMLVLRRTR